MPAGVRTAHGKLIVAVIAPPGRSRTVKLQYSWSCLCTSHRKANHQAAS
jgi:hypothetical protein